MAILSAVGGAISGALGRGAANIGSAIKGAAIEIATRPFKDAWHEAIHGSFGSLGSSTITGASTVVQGVMGRDQALKIKISSAFDQKLSSVREPILHLGEFKADPIRADDPIKSIDKVHGTIIKYLNIVNKNTEQTFEYVRSSVKQQNTRIEDIKKSAIIVEKSYNNLSERVTKLNIRVSELERQRKTSSAGGGSIEDANPVAAAAAAEEGGGGSIMDTIKGLIIGRLGGGIAAGIATRLLPLLLPILGGAAAVGGGIWAGTKLREIIKEKYDYDPGKRGGDTGPDALERGSAFKDKEGVEAYRKKLESMGISREEQAKRGLHPPANKNAKPEEKPAIGGSGATGTWDDKRTGASIEKFTLKKQSISMQSSTDFKMGAKESIEFKARKILLTASDCIRFDAPKIVFSTKPRILEEEIPENARPTSGQMDTEFSSQSRTSQARTRMPRGGLTGGRGSGGSGGGGGAMGAGMGGGGGAGMGGGGGAGMGGGGTSGGTGGTMGLGRGGSPAGGFQSGGGGGFGGQGGTGTWGGSVPDKNPMRDPNTPAFGSSYGQGQTFAAGRGAVVSGGRGGWSPGASRPSSSGRTGGPPSSRRTGSGPRTGNDPPRVPLIEETYPGHEKGGTGPNPLIPSRDDPTKPADPNDTRKGHTIQDIQEAVRGGYDDPVGPGGSPFLQNERAKYKQEIENTPGLREHIAAIVQTENANDPQGVVESIMNRATEFKKSIKEITSFGRDGVRGPIDPSSFYGPIRRGEVRDLIKAGINKTQLNRVDRGLNPAYAGSDKLEGRTDQGMYNPAKGINEHKERTGIKEIDGEHYSYHNEKSAREKLARQRAYDVAHPRDPNRKPGQLQQTPRDDQPLDYYTTKSPPNQSNRDREARNNNVQPSSQSREGFVEEGGPQGPEHHYGAGRGDHGRKHSGVDEKNLKDGDSYKNKVDGEVLYNGHNKGYQWNIVIRGDDGIIRRYATHGQTDLSLKPGDRVKKGTHIGYVARSHTHYEEIPEYLNGKPNPKYQEMIRNKGQFVSTQNKDGTIDPRQRKRDAEAKEKKEAEEKAKRDAANPPVANTTANTTPAPTANTTLAPTANTRPAATVGGGSQGNTAAQENEKAGRPFWQLGSNNKQVGAVTYPPGTVLSDETPDAVQAGQQYAGLTMTPPPVTPATTTTARPPPPYLPPGMTPHSGPQYNPPSRLKVRSEFDPTEGLPSLTTGGPNVKIDPSQSLLRPVGSDVGPPLDIRSDDQKGVGPPLDIRSDEQKKQDAPVHPNQPAVPRTQADVNKQLADLASKRSKEKLNWKSSVVDMMKLLGKDSSQKARIKLAKELGYTGKPNSRSRNVWLQQKLRSNLLAPAVPLPYTGPDEGQGKGKRLDPNVPLEDQLGTGDIVTPRSTILSGTPYGGDTADVQGAPGTQAGPPGNLSRQLGANDIFPPAVPTSQLTPSETSQVTPTETPQAVPVETSAALPPKETPEVITKEVPQELPKATPAEAGPAHLATNLANPQGLPAVMDQEVPRAPISTGARKRDLRDDPLIGQEGLPTGTATPQEGVTKSQDRFISENKFSIKGTGQVLSDENSDVAAGQQYAGMKNTARAGLGGSIRPPLMSPPESVYPNRPILSADNPIIKGDPPTGPQVTKGSMYGTWPDRITKNNATASSLPGGWYDEGDVERGSTRENPKPLLPYTGAPLDQPGVALPFTGSRGTGGKNEGAWVEVENPLTGEPTYVRVADTGPGQYLNPNSRRKGIDLNAPLLEFFGFVQTQKQKQATGKPIYTDRDIKWEVVSIDRIAEKYAEKQARENAFLETPIIPPIQTVDNIPAVTPDKPVPHTPDSTTAIPPPSTAVSTPKIPQIDQSQAAPAIVEATRAAKDIEVDREKKRADDEKKKADDSDKKEKDTKRDKENSDTKEKKSKEEKPEEKVVKPTHDPETERKGPGDSGYGSSRTAADSSADPVEMQE